MTEQDQVEFHEQVRATEGRSLPARIGIVAGAAVLFAVGVAAAMGASPSPSTGPGAGASTAPDASTAPGTSTAPTSTNPPKGDRPGFGAGPGPFGLPAFGGFGFGDITISTISGSSLSLKTADGWTRTIAVTDSTKIMKGGATIAVGDLAVGDKVRFAETRNADGTYSVSAINVILPTVVGQVSAISGDTLTITQPGGTTATIHVGSGTTYQVDGKTGALSDVKVGAFVIAEGMQRADGSLDAAAIHSGFGGGFGKFPGNGFPGDHGPRDPNASPAPSSGAS
jgi:hypothetical protein